MLAAVERIEKYAARGRAVFESNELIQNWMVRHLQIIGEAARALSPELRSRHPDVPWSEIVGMRTILVHRYFDVDADVVWAAIERDLPPLRSWLEMQVSDMSK
jgi:uncharacterized protein with HEPN domain